MPRNIGKHGELFAHLCDPEHLIQSARAAARQKK